MIPNGFLVTAAVLLPNAIFFLIPPADMQNDPEAKPNRLEWIMTILERIGQAGCFILPCFYNLKLDNPVRLYSAGIASIFLIFYYAGWFRYFITGRKYKFLFSPMLYIPIPLAIFPVFYFFAVSVWILSAPLFIAASFLSVGHIFNTLMSWKKIKGIS